MKRIAYSQQKKKTFIFLRMKSFYKNKFWIQERVKINFLFYICSASKENHKNKGEFILKSYSKE